jgi:hypothetical protein
LSNEYQGDILLFDKVSLAILAKRGNQVCRKGFPKERPEAEAKQRV